MKKESYFFQFLEPVSKELGLLAKELENGIYTSPRVMLTHSRVFVENILKRVIEAENLTLEGHVTLLEQIQLLDRSGIVTSQICNDLHFVRKTGNQAAHDPRKFRYSEALLAWESIYRIVKWYLEVYGPLDIEVPEYRDPLPKENQSYHIEELVHKLESLEKKLTDVLNPADNEVVVKSEVKELTTEIEEPYIEPGLVPIRTIVYKDKKIDIPFFLRDAFLLPQRFSRSETFLIRLGSQQQARIMSELPQNIEGISKYVKRFSEKNEEIFFEELREFVKEEIARRQIVLEHPGELFIFFKSDYIILTEKLSSIPLSEDYFSGIPNLLKQLREDQKEKVGHLPKELVILAKYERVGIGTVQKLFEQLKTLQQQKSLELVY